MLCPAATWDLENLQDWTDSFRQNVIHVESTLTCGSCAGQLSSYEERNVNATLACFIVYYEISNNKQLKVPKKRGIRTLSSKKQWRRPRRVVEGTMQM